MSGVKLEHIYKRFGKVTAVGDFNIEVKDGEFVSFLGPSGCGKTTTLRMVAGFEKPTEGTITIGDTVMSDASKGFFMAPENRGVGMVFQSYAVWPHMNVIDNVAYPLKIQKVPKEERLKRVMNILEVVHLQEYAERLPNQLSGGQQQRVAEPGLLLLDEPLSNLDAKLRESMRFEISGLQKKLGITVIYVTHDQSEAMTMSDRIVVMSMGKVQQIGTPVEVYSHPANQMVADFVGLVNFIPSEVRGDGKVYLENTDIAFPNEKALSGKVILAVRPENISLHKDRGMIKGLLHHHFYLGDSIDYRVRVKDHFIRVIVKGAEFGRFRDGDEVFLDFDKVLTFPKQ